MRRLIGAAAIAAAAFAYTAPAQAQYDCYGVRAADREAGVCSGSWCMDECFVVAYTYCDLNAKYCGAIDCFGSTPPTGCDKP
ncbi:MAG TPA: hypothetical protein VGX28_08700 [Frankiaceae bacterium]|jgi:hypothetical protein|nr:hypothetical protein [Frankiaceae bacterium]